MIGSFGLMPVSKLCMSLVSATAPNQLTITMKVQELSSTPTPQPNSQWNVLFTAPNGTEYFVDLHVQADESMPLLEAHVLSGKVKGAIRSAVPEITTSMSCSWIARRTSSMSAGFSSAT